VEAKLAGIGRPENRRVVQAYPRWAVMAGCAVGPTLAGSCAPTTPGSVLLPCWS
jgi:hypothetical protein